MTDAWCVAVFKCKPDDIKRVLIDFYNFVRGIDGVINQHFLIRDRVNDEVVSVFVSYLNPNPGNWLEVKLFTS